MKKKKIFFTLFFLSLAILILDQLGWLDWPKGKLIRWTGRLRESGYQKIANSSDSEEKIETQLLSCQTEILALREENDRLRRLLGAGIKPETKLVSARVIGANQSWLMVALTGQNGINKDASVVRERILLGRVDRVEGNLALVRLLTHPELKIPVKIWLRKELAEKGELDLAEGILTSRGGQLVVKEILAKEKIVPGYWVGAVVESGDVFLVGSITKVYPSKDKVFQEAELEWAINPRKLLTVAIVKTNEK